MQHSYHASHHVDGCVSAGTGDGGSCNRTERKTNEEMIMDEDVKQNQIIRLKTEFLFNKYTQIHLLIQEHTDTVRTSQETHHVSVTEPNRLMLCGETVAVCCENCTEHTYTLCGQSVPHRRHITSLTEPNRLMLGGKQSLFVVRTVRNTQIHCGQPVPTRRHITSPLQSPTG
jgi:hypothetical protein